jgi:hypothetical protein
MMHLLPDSRHTVILTGFQAAGTRGRALAEGATELKVFGHYVPVRAEVVVEPRPAGALSCPSSASASASTDRARMRRAWVDLTDTGVAELVRLDIEGNTHVHLWTRVCTAAAPSCQGPGRVPLPPSTWRSRASARCSSSTRGRGRGRTAQQQPMAGPSSRPNPQTSSPKVGDGRPRPPS